MFQKTSLGVPFFSELLIFQVDGEQIEEKWKLTFSFIKKTTIKAESLKLFFQDKDINILEAKQARIEQLDSKQSYIHFSMKNLFSSKNEKPSIILQKNLSKQISFSLVLEYCSQETLQKTIFDIELELSQNQSYEKEIIEISDTSSFPEILEEGSLFLDKILSKALNSEKTSAIKGKYSRRIPLSQEISYWISMHKCILIAMKNGFQNADEAQRQIIAYWNFIIKQVSQEIYNDPAFRNKLAQYVKSSNEWIKSIKIQDTIFLLPLLDYQEVLWGKPEFWACYRFWDMLNKIQDKIRCIKKFLEGLSYKNCLPIQELQKSLDVISQELKKIQGQIVCSHDKSDPQQWMWHCIMRLQSLYRQSIFCLALAMEERIWSEIDDLWLLVYKIYPGLQKIENNMAKIYSQKEIFGENKKNGSIVSFYKENQKETIEKRYIDIFPGKMTKKEKWFYELDEDSKGFRIYQQFWIPVNFSEQERPELYRALQKLVKIYQETSENLFYQEILQKLLDVPEKVSLQKILSSIDNMKKQAIQAYLLEYLESKDNREEIFQTLLPLLEIGKMEIMSEKIMEKHERYVPYLSLQNDITREYFMKPEKKEKPIEKENVVNYVNLACSYPYAMILKENTKQCILESTYTFTEKDIYQTGSKVKLVHVGFCIEKANHQEVLCSLMIDTCEYPYIALEPVGKDIIQITQEQNQTMIAMSLMERREIAILVDTSHPSIFSPDSLNTTMNISLPIYYKFGSLSEKSKFRPVIYHDPNEDNTKPFLLKYQLKICPVFPYSGFVGIDFGTTSTCVSYLPNSSDTLMPKMLQLDGIIEMPTWIYFEDIQKKMVNGKEEKISKIGKISKLYLRKNFNPKLLVRGIKRYLGADSHHNIHQICYNNYRYHYETEEIVSLYLDSLQTEFAKKTNAFFGQVGNTSPCNFGIAEKNALIRSYERMIPPVYPGKLELHIDETTGAAIFYTIKEIEEQNISLEEYVQIYGKSDGYIQKNLLMYDFGGGTIDISLVSICIKAQEVHFKILGNTSIMDFGGDNVTLALFTRMKAYFCYLILQGDEVDRAYNNHRPGLASQETWYEKFLQLKLSRKHLEQYLKNDSSLNLSDRKNLENIIQNLFITNFALWEEGSFEKRDALELFCKFWDCCEELKKALCLLGEKVELKKFATMFIDPLDEWCKQLGIQDNTTVLEDRLDKISITLAKDLYPFIYTPIKQSARAMKLICMTENEFSFHEVHEIRLVGNSSKIPLVAQLLQEEMEMPYSVGYQKIHFKSDVKQMIKLADENTKTSVSQGMTMALAIMSGTSTIKMDIDKQTDALTYEIGFKPPIGTWHTVFAKGTKLPLKEVPIYKVNNLNSIHTLEMFRRIGRWHKVPGQPGEILDEYEPDLYSLGKFIFEEKYALPKIDNISVREDHIAFFYNQQGEFSAQKMDRIYRFQWCRNMHPESDPLSGLH